MKKEFHYISKKTYKVFTCEYEFNLFINIQKHKGIYNYSTKVISLEPHCPTEGISGHSIN